MSTSLPLVTFVVMCYNQEQYIREALEGAFAQTYEPLEILISDDCSRDRTFEVVQEMVNTYLGPHNVVCRKNETNGGIAAHLNKINSLVNGELIVIAAGDDISLPHRTEKLVAEYTASNKETNYFYSSAREMTLSGSLQGIVTSPGADCASSKLRTALSPYPLAIGATQAWTRALIDSFSPFHADVWAEDQILGFRGVLLGEVCFIDEALVCYRIGSGISTQKQKFSIKKYFKGKRSAIGIYRQRWRDSVHVGSYSLAIALAVKITLLTASIPVSPLISAAQKLIKR